MFGFRRLEDAIDIERLERKANDHELENQIKALQNRVGMLEGKMKERPLPFGTGDVVKLKSGGPKMTVGPTLPDKPEMIQLAWFDGHKFHTELTSVGSLSAYGKVEAK